MPSIQSDLDRILYDKILEHLSKINAYVPGPIKKAGGLKANLLERYSQDPLFSIFGLDSLEYIGATLSGGTVTSIHRKLGDIYQDSVQTIFVQALGLSQADVVYSAAIASGDISETRSADVYLQFSKLRVKDRSRIKTFCNQELKRLTAKPQVTLIGIGREVRQCYATGDSKRAQADEAMGRHLLLSGILPVIPFFCNQSNPSIIRRYKERSIWIALFLIQ